MKTLISAAAAIFALTGVAHAQEAQTPATEEGKSCCCEKMHEGGHDMSEMPEHGEDQQ